MTSPRAAQRGGFFLGMIVGLLIGLALALGVAVYITKVPLPFIDKVPQRTPEQDAAEMEHNKSWDPNSPLYGKNPAVPKAVPVASAPSAASEPEPTEAPVVSAEPASAPAAKPASAPVASPQHRRHRHRVLGHIGHHQGHAVAFGQPQALQVGRYRLRQAVGLGIRDVFAHETVGGALCMLAKTVFQQLHQ